MFFSLRAFKLLIGRNFSVTGPDWSLKIILQQFTVFLTLGCCGKKTIQLNRSQTTTTIRIIIIIEFILCHMIVTSEAFSINLFATTLLLHYWQAACGLWGCKNWPAPFPGRMSYKTTKPGLVSVLYLSMHYNYGIVVYYGPFLCIVSFHCYVCCLLVLLVKLSVLAKWLCPHSFVFPWAVSYLHYNMG